MGDLKFCPACGAQLAANDSFCGECGYDINSPAAATANQPQENGPVSATAPYPAERQPPVMTDPYTAPVMPAPAGNIADMGVKSSSNKIALVIMVSLLALLFMASGGLYCWISRGEEPGTQASLPTAGQNQIAAPSKQTASDRLAQLDLTRASTYLSEPGLKCTFFVNYPDGTAGVVQRISAQIVSNEAVRVSEVETGVDQGEDFGYGFHYVERADGTYYILDETPNEIFPLLKNSMTVGQSWNYQDEYGQVTWTVLDMGVDLNLGFTSFEDCLLVKEDNQAVDFQSITYYAPGRGSVLVIDPSDKTEYYKLTAIEKIDLAQTAESLKKWCPNYYDIKDDRNQSY
ncbi:MAG: zinc ribbon domain-containing protein [Syntrophomonadaceae bacterium]|nr:zinc ribbon domain-containing protein [Syntrophomonadaceae bacterium]